MRIQTAQNVFGNGGPVFIVNPSSGRGKTMGIWNRMRNEITSMGLTFTEYLTNRPADAEEYVKTLSPQSCSAVFSVGGDGTLNEIVNGLCKRWLEDEGLSIVPIPVTVIPTGSGNDCVKTMGMGRDILKDICSTLSGTHRIIDIGMVNGRYFINVSGAGFDAEVVARFNDGKVNGKLKGTLGYMGALLATLRKFKGMDAKIMIDGRSFQGKILLIAVGNGKYYGGGMEITPGADPSDGQFEVCWVDDMPTMEFLASLMSVFKGRHTANKRVHIHKGKRIEIAGGDARVQADGEIVGCLPTVWTLIPNALKIMVPDSSAS